MDFVEKWNFFLSAFFTEIISENIFFDIVERKDYFKWKKIEVLKRARKWTFFKGVSRRFCPKKYNFYYLCFSLKLCHKRFFFDIYEKKRMILSGKNWTFEKKDQKMNIFQRG